MKQIALLRGINVGGHTQVAMADLRGMLEALGFTDVKSLLQSGNLIFESRDQKGAALESLLETETAKRLGVSADYVVRSAREWQTVVERNPFAKEAERDPSHLLVMFMKLASGSKAVEALQAGIRGPETIHADGKQLTIVYPAGIGRSKLTGALIEKKLGVRGTGRN